MLVGKGLGLLIRGLGFRLLIKGAMDLFKRYSILPDQHLSCVTACKRGL